MIHELPLSQRTLHGYFSRDLEPVLTIAPGDAVRLSVPNSSWFIEPERKVVPRDPVLDIGHALAGPIAVRGARVGQTLAVRIDAITPGSWGVTYTKPPHLIRWQLADGVARGIGGGRYVSRPSWESSGCRQPSRAFTRRPHRVAVAET